MATVRPLRKVQISRAPANLEFEPASRAVTVTGRKPFITNENAGSNGIPNILHVGCGPRSPHRLHEFFRRGTWNEIRCDIEPAYQPDVLASIADLKSYVGDRSCDAIWGSHIIEHLARHEVSLALSEFVRVLKPSGFALIRTPDIEVVAEFILDGRINDIIYTSPAGPITPLDMIYGHGASIAQQRSAMRHGTAFTSELLGNDLLAAGFGEVRTTRTKTYEVWAVAFGPEANVPAILKGLAQTGIDFRN